ncbi:unnamed protein product [Prunus brigantina]
MAECCIYIWHGFSVLFFSGSLTGQTRKVLLILKTFYSNQVAVAETRKLLINCKVIENTRQRPSHGRVSRCLHLEKKKEDTTRPGSQTSPDRLGAA